MPGPPPSPNPIRRNKPDLTHLEVQPVVNPQLKKLRSRSTKTIATQTWWDTWANGEQAQYFMETDWLRLQQVAILVERLFRAEMSEETQNGRPASANGLTLLMAEIRQNEGLLGATIMDRMRLRMRAKEASTDKPPVIQSEVEVDDELYRDLS